MASQIEHTLSMRPLIAPELERSLRAILGGVDYGILFTDLDHQSLICNARFGEQFLISPGDVVSNDVDVVRSMVHRRIANVSEWQRNLTIVYESPELEQTDELQLVNPSCVLRRYTGPVRNENGDVTGRLWTFLDITQEVKKRTQQEALYRTALYFDNDPQRVCQFIAEEVSVHFQSIALISLIEGSFLRFHTLAGVPESMPVIEGNRIDESLCQFCLSSESPVVIQDAKTYESAQGTLPAKLGLTRYAGVPIYRSGGNVIGTLCILDTHSDIKIGKEDVQFLSFLAMRVSAELDRQEQLESLQLNLADTSKTLQETQQKLIQSEKLAVAGALSASVAHDIRNILASMNLQIDMASKDPAKALAYVQDSLGRFSVLAHRLMSYAKPKQAMVEHINLVEIVQRVIVLLTPQFSVSKVSFHQIYPSEAIFIKGDEGRLEHLFVNLLINALQSVGPGGNVHLTVSKADGVVSVAVQDDGRGVSKDVIGRLFEPFSSTKKDGFGLGLFSCKQIADDHNAEIICEPNESVGTTFKVNFREI